MIGCYIVKIVTLGIYMQTYTNDFSDPEKLMRTLEIRRPWENDSSDHSGKFLSDLIKVSLFFMEYSKKTGDYRFFNTALKINDLLRGNKNKLADKNIFREICSNEEEILKNIKKIKLQ